MKKTLLKIKVIYGILTNEMNNIAFVKLPNSVQEKLIQGKETTVNISYIGVDERVINMLKDTLEEKFNKEQE